MSHFEKVSFERWKADCGVKGLDDKGLRVWYDAIKMPRQATAASAGCDFYMPFSLNFEGGSSFRIATGVRWVCDEEAGDRDKVLLIVPRSGLGFKYGIKLSNTVGVIDADYRGELCVVLVNLSDSDFTIEPGERIAQIVLARHETIEWEETTELGATRRGEGRFGSTGRK